jgi:hypothetical protein
MKKFAFLFLISLLEALNHDRSNGEPYVNHLAGHHRAIFIGPDSRME